jgi:hypothetical protein
MNSQTQQFFTLVIRWVWALGVKPAMFFNGCTQGAAYFKAGTRIKRIQRIVNMGNSIGHSGDEQPPYGVGLGSGNPVNAGKAVRVYDGMHTHTLSTYGKTGKAVLL